MDYETVMYRVVNRALLDELLLKAHESPRRRSHMNFHSDYEEPVQRVFIGLASGTYVRPHMHPQHNKWEMIIGVRGKSLLLIFEPNGELKERIVLSENDLSFGVEIKPGTWHTVLPLDDESVILEIKQGPFDPSGISEFAQWAPEENDEDTGKFLDWATRAQVNERYSEHGLYTPDKADEVLLD